MRIRRQVTDRFIPNVTSAFVVYCVGDLSTSRFKLSEEAAADGEAGARGTCAMMQSEGDDVSTFAAGTNDDSSASATVTQRKSPHHGQWVIYWCVLVSH